MTQTTVTKNIATTIVWDLEQALQAADDIFPYVPVLAVYAPAIAAAIKGVHIVAEATGVEPVAAQPAVVDTLTPGAPGAPALS